MDGEIEPSQGGPAAGEALADAVERDQRMRA